MSTNSECEFIETAPNVWYYVLENYNAPKNSWDWREYAQAFGPFKSEDMAREHLRDNHANPGGSWTRPFKPGYAPDEIMQKLMTDAADRKAASAANAIAPMGVMKFGQIIRIRSESGTKGARYVRSVT